MGARARRCACGVCWTRRGAKKTWNDVADLARHAKQAHPELGYVPLKWVEAA